MEGAQALGAAGADAAAPARRRGRRAANAAGDQQPQPPQSSRLRWLKPRLRRRGSTDAAGGADVLALPQQPQQQQQQQRRRGRRRGNSNGGSAAAAAPQPTTLEEERQQAATAAAAAFRGAPLPTTTPPSSFPPLLKPPVVVAPALSPEAAAAPSPLPAPPSSSACAQAATTTTTPPSSSSLPPLLEQIALGAVGALTTALVTGISALQAQQQALAGRREDEGQEGRGKRAGASALAPPQLPLAARTAGITASAVLGGFPLVLLPAPVPIDHEDDGNNNHQHPQQPPQPQRLLAAGTRAWGSGAWWDGRSLMRVRIYDFALYADAAAAARAKQALMEAAAATAGPSPSSPSPSSSSPSSLADALALSAAATDDVPATILLRAARDVPLSRLADEYERILRRRVAAAMALEGGQQAADESDADEPALRALLAAFRDPSRLPRAALSDGSGGGGGSGEPAVARGASLTFERLPGGRVLARCITPAAAAGVSPADADASPAATAAAGDVVTTLADVTSPTLCRALFGLYLADQPVSAKAKAAAADSLARLLEEGEGEEGRRRPRGRSSVAASAYRPRKGDRLVCDRLEVAPLEEQQHDACVLVPAYD
jgi:hypothetical protein